MSNSATPASTRKTMTFQRAVKPSLLTHFETLSNENQIKVFKEINKQLQRHLDKIMYGFSWEKVEMTKREKSNNITASEFLQI